jgi:hypothetical protein
MRTKGGYGGIVRIPKNVYQRAVKLKLDEEALKGISQPLHYYIGIVHAELFRDILDSQRRKPPRMLRI